MVPERVRPPYAADERTQLIGWLDLQRSIVHYKCEGLSDANAHKAVLPDSPLMTAAGLVQHLRWVEHCWFNVMFLGESNEHNPQFHDPDGGDFMVDAGVPLAQVLDEYAAQCADSNRIAAEHALDDTGRNTDFDAGAASLRWVVLHMIEETGRHAGHLDLIRELLDGGKGYY